MKKVSKTVKKEVKKKKQPGYVDAELVNLGKRMRALRIRNGYTSFESFAYDNDLPRVLYGNYEKGAGNITYKNLIKVVRALGVTLKEFFGEGFEK
jgi:transcriptional regulator with XRE-family HTH domain